ncbi:MAG TPA: hypothetical protein VGN40_07865 [Lelliottia sp.]|jgi:ABC-type Fe2+-enterobactin transport system substrate-binding protein
MSNENNVVNLNRIKNLTRDDVIDQLERCQMAAEVTLPVANMEALLTQLLGYMDNSKPELHQKLTESERYGRQADITIENLERKVEQLAAENAALKGALHPSDIPSEWNDVFGDTAVIQHDSAGDNQGHSVSWSWVGNQEEVIKYVPLAVYNDIKTPATDAILSEVRASGVDSAIAELNQLAERSEKEAPVAAEHHRSASLYLQLFAAQLRKGVQS